MCYFNKRLLFILIASVVVFSGCASKGKKDGEMDPAALGEDGSLILIPSPYVAGEVPGPAKREFAAVKALMEQKKWKEAVGSLELMTATYPTLSGPYVNLGIAHFQLKEFEEAEKALKFAIETNPLNFDAYTQLGYLLRDQGRFEEAEQNYLAALALWPHHLESAYNLGILYDLYMGRFEDALKYYVLSQQILGGEDRQLKGWIVDLQRRMEQ